MSNGSARDSVINDQKLLKQKYLVVDDEIVKNENDKEDFIIDVGVSKDLALFASNYEEALEMINLHSDIAICFIDSKIPKSSKNLYDFDPHLSSERPEWGISLIPKINQVHKDATIVIYSAYVTKTYLIKKAQQYNNIIGFFGKPEGIKHRQQLYLEAIAKNSAGKISSDNLGSSTQNIFDYATLNEDLSLYVREKTQVIKKLIRRSAQDIIDIGKSLIDIKEKLEHGQFYSWLELEFSWSYRTAHRFMRVAETFESDNLSDLDILPSALYELSAPSIPLAASREAILRAEQGETISLDLAKAIKNKHQTKVNTINPVDQKLHDCEEAITNPENFNTVTQKPQILKVIRQQNLWQLGEHLLFCGNPNSAEFINQIPPKIALNLAFPRERNWSFSVAETNSQMTFYNQYDEDIDTQLLLEAVERFIKITTDEKDNLTICFIPHPAILPLVHRLGCRGFIAEPDPLKCEAVRSVWHKFQGD